MENLLSRNEAAASKEREVKGALNIDGFKWTWDLYNVTPQWTVEPNEDIIAATVITALGDACPFQNDTVSKIECLAQGALNKIYLLCCDAKELIVRIALPVDPMWKTLSEVATLTWVREHTSLPVSEILYYNNTRENSWNATG